MLHLSVKSWWVWLYLLLYFSSMSFMHLFPLSKLKLKIFLSLLTISSLIWQVSWRIYFHFLAWSIHCLHSLGQYFSHIRQSFVCCHLWFLQSCVWALCILYYCWKCLSVCFSHCCESHLFILHFAAKSCNIWALHLWILNLFYWVAIIMTNFWAPLWYFSLLLLVCFVSVHFGFKPFLLVCIVIVNFSCYISHCLWLLLLCALIFIL